MKTFLAIFFVLVGAIVAPHRMIAEKSETSARQCDSPSEAQRALIPTFRVLNTAQAKFRGANGRYASLQELLASNETKRLAKEDGVSLGPASDPTSGYTFRLVVGEDQKAYTISAWKSADPCKYVGATTDDRGVIFLTQALK